MYTELHGQDKREEGDRGDQEEKRGKSKGERAIQSVITSYVLSTVWIPQRCSRSYTEKRRRRKEIEVTRRRKGGNQKERDRSSQ